MLPIVTRTLPLSRTVAKRSRAQRSTPVVPHDGVAVERSRVNDVASCVVVYEGPVPVSPSPPTNRSLFDGGCLNPKWPRALTVVAAGRSGSAADQVLVAGSNS